MLTDDESETRHCLNRLGRVVRESDLPGEIQVRLCHIMDLLENSGRVGAAAEHLCMTRALLVVEHGYDDDDQLLLDLMNIEIDLIDIFNARESRDTPSD